VFFYASGTVGKLWEANTFGTTAGITYPSLAPFDGGLVFNDDTTGSFLLYDPSTGGISTIGTYTVAGDTPLMAATGSCFLHTRNQTIAYQAPDTTAATTGTVTSSLADFDSSLTKYFKAVKIDADIPANSSIDIAYRLEDLDGSYTTVQTGAANGTEYTIGANGRAISIKVTLNKGTSTDGPTLKRVYVRAVPLPANFKRASYILNLTGRNGEQHAQCRDGSLHPKDGLELATSLRTALTSTTPVSITDRFGTFTGILEGGDGFELMEVRPEEFIARVRVREV
jgi:hypothetical protein